MYKMIGLLLLLSAFCFAGEPHKWNEEAIDWVAYKEATGLMKDKGKKGLLVVYADWCSTCRTFSKQFKDPSVVQASKSFVMIKANVEKDQELAQKYNLDGSYVPRTFVLNEKGEVIEELYPEKPKWRFFLPSDNSAFLGAFMKRAATFSAH